MYNIQDSGHIKERKELEGRERGVFVETKKIKVLRCMSRSGPGWIQTSAELTDHSKRDGSSWNIPEIRCAALHTDPRQVSPRLTGGKDEQI